MLARGLTTDDVGAIGFSGADSFAISGRWVAFATFAGDKYDPGFSSVHVVSLASGRTRAIGRPGGRVRELVFAADGALGGITHNVTLGDASVFTVGAFNSTRGDVIDAGPIADVDNLALNGSELTWRNGVRTHSTTLR